MDRTSETAAVKRALAAAGITAKVSHGTGTARAWLHIKIFQPSGTADQERAERIAREVTGRAGPYGGCIIVGCWL